MAKHTAFQAILLEAGFSLRVATHIATTLDRLRLSGLASDDLAAAFFRWRQEAVECRWVGFQLGRKIRPGLIDVPGLFDGIEEDQRMAAKGH